MSDRGDINIDKYTAEYKDLKEFFLMEDMAKRYNATIKVNDATRDKLYILKGVCLKNHKHKTWNEFFEAIVIPNILFAIGSGRI